MNQKKTSDTMPFNVIETLLKVAHNQGYNTVSLCHECGLDYDPKHDANNKPDVVSTRVYSKIYRKVMEILQDESFGLQQKSKNPPGTFRMMCLFIIHCRNLQQALIRAAEFFDYIDSISQGKSSKRQAISFEQNDQVCVNYFQASEHKHANDVRADASILFMMHRFICWLISDDIPLLEVYIMSHVSTDSPQQLAMFDCPICFGQTHNAFKYSSEYLTKPIVQTEETLKEFLRHAPYQLISRQHNDTQNQLSQRIRSMLIEHLHSEPPKIEEVASKLNISSRTIHRRLIKENTSFQKLKDEVRCDAAINYLSRPELSINAIAVLMGFHDTSAFYRAFKKWTGKSPGAYRKI